MALCSILGIHLVLKSLPLCLCPCRSGSVVVDTTTVFRDKNSVPSAANATSLFSSELSKSTALNVIPGSVSARKLLHEEMNGLQVLIYLKIKCVFQCHTCNSLVIFKYESQMTLEWSFLLCLHFWLVKFPSVCRMSPTNTSDFSNISESTSTSGCAPWPTVGSLVVLSLTLLAAAQMLMDI